jgi:hypothetical protein
MGAWGAGAFQNDTAVDWVAQLQESSGDSLLRSAIEPAAAIDGGGLLDSGVAAIALAAAEVVAAAKGQPGGDLPETLSSWVAQFGSDVGDDLPIPARQAVERIAASSELKELWDEAGDNDWNEVVGDLRARLATIAADLP